MFKNLPYMLKAATGAGSLAIGPEVGKAVTDILVWLFSLISSVPIPEQVYNSFVLLIGMVIAGVAVYFVPNKAALSTKTNEEAA